MCFHRFNSNNWDYLSYYRIHLVSKNSITYDHFTNLIPSEAFEEQPLLPPMKMAQNTTIGSGTFAEIFCEFFANVKECDSDTLNDSGLLRRNISYLFFHDVYM